MSAIATPASPASRTTPPPARPPLGYDPAALPRELARHYIPASDADLAAMLRAVGAQRLDDLFSHLPANIRMTAPPPVPEELSYDALLDRLAALAARNAPAAAFLGDGLPVYRVPPIVAEVASIRNLTTAYTPYQPERSQGTLLTHWIYQCLLAQLTGFEAVNSSLYDRASALFEASCCALRLAEDSAADTVLVAESLFPSDIEVLQTHAADTAMRVETVPFDPATGLLDPAAVRARAQALGPRLAAIAFPQINNLGLLENVDALTAPSRSLTQCSSPPAASSRPRTGAPTAAAPTCSWAKASTSPSARISAAPASASSPCATTPASKTMSAPLRAASSARPATSRGANAA
jgi:glycine cleavage system pyridoxal-binding protein P